MYLITIISINVYKYNQFQNLSKSYSMFPLLFNAIQLLSYTIINILSNIVLHIVYIVIYSVVQVIQDVKKKPFNIYMVNSTHHTE